MENYKCFSKTLTLTIIPDVLIFDNILPRLPVKSLIRFKSVSKLWNSVICTSQFTISHLHFSSSLSPHFLIQSQRNIYTLAYNHNLKELVKLERPWDHYLDVIGCSNGLLCLYFLEYWYEYPADNYFIIWNPATGQQHNIIRIPFNSDSETCTLGFGCYQVGSTHDYKIIAGFPYEDHLWVFSLRVGHWKSIRLPTGYNNPFYMVPHDRAGVYFDGSLYWSACVNDNICICSFSLIDEQFNHEASLLKPANMILRGGSHRLLVFRGCLSIIWNSSESSDVFSMKKEGDSISWQKLFSRPKISNVICLDFSITGKCLVKQSHIDQNANQQLGGELKLVDVTLEDFEHSIGFELEYVYSVHHYAESLVSPFTLM